MNVANLLRLYADMIEAGQLCGVAVVSGNGKTYAAGVPFGIDAKTALMSLTQEIEMPPVLSENPLLYKTRRTYTKKRDGR